MRCTSPFEMPHGDTLLLLPCGQCMSCRLTRSHVAAMRCVHELSSWEGALFVTLTYDDRFLIVDDVSGAASLSLVDFQKFLKRLRVSLSKQGRRVKHFSCGEYGGETNRPHYHSVLFGLTIDDCVQTGVGWRCPLVEEAWGQGLVDVGTATYDSFKYIAKYIIKEPSGVDRELLYGNLFYPFHCRSQGLGKDFVLKNWVQIVGNDGILFKGKKYGFPPIYRVWLDKLYSDLFNLDFPSGQRYSSWWANRKELLEDIRSGRDVLRIDQEALNVSGRIIMQERSKHV